MVPDPLSPWSIIQGDALACLSAHPDGVVDCVVTSPPYWGLRQYLFEGAVMLRPNLSAEERKQVLSRLEAIGVTPKI